MQQRSQIVRSLISLVCLASSTPLLAGPPPADNKPEAKKTATSSFLRLQRDRKSQPVAVATATVRYVPASGEGGVSVDLVGVVHVADRAYYRKLNQQLQQYDVVLYELVAPQGTRLPRPSQEQKNNPLAMLHQLAK